jgi:hypothetical protein
VVRIPLFSIGLLPNRIGLYIRLGTIAETQTQRLNNFTQIRSREESDDAAIKRRNAAELGYFVLESKYLRSIAINFAFGIRGIGEKKIVF